MHVIVLHLVNFAFLSLCQILILFLEVLDNLSVVNLFRSLFVDLLLSDLFNLKHDFVQAVLVNQTESEPLTLVKQEVHVNVPQDLLLKSLY